jgi:hypothetical protein
MSASIGDFIDEALGIKGPEDLLNLVLAGVSIVFVVVGLFMSTMETFSLTWWSLFGFECMAVLLCASCLYVVHVALPSVAVENRKEE